MSSFDSNLNFKYSSSDKKKEENYFENHQKISIINPCSIRLDAEKKKYENFLEKLKNLEAFEENNKKILNQYNNFFDTFGTHYFKNINIGFLSLSKSKIKCKNDECETNENVSTNVNISGAQLNFGKKKAKEKKNQL